MAVGQGRPAAHARRRAHEPPHPTRGVTSTVRRPACRAPCPRRSRQRPLARPRRHGGAGRRGLHLELVSLDAARGDRRGRDGRGPAAARGARLWWTARPESLWESLLRLLHVVVRHRGGAAVGRWWTPTECSWREADLWLVGTTALHEFDGDEHEKAPRRVNDRRRDRRRRQAGLRAPGIHRRETCIHRAVTDPRGRRPVARQAARPQPIRRVAQLLRDSLFTPAGRARLPPADPGCATPAATDDGGGRSPCRARQCAIRRHRRRAAAEGGGRSRHRMRPADVRCAATLRGRRTGWPRPRGITLGVRPLRQAVPRDFLE